MVQKRRENHSAFTILQCARHYLRGAAPHTPLHSLAPARRARLTLVGDLLIGHHSRFRVLVGLDNHHESHVYLLCWLYGLATLESARHSLVE